MPFLWLTGQAQVDEVELAGRLCPYVGRLERVDQGATRLWHSAITSWVGALMFAR